MTHQTRTGVIRIGLLILLATAFSDPAVTQAASKTTKSKPAVPAVAVETALRYADALAAGDHAATAQLDFACQYRLLDAGSATEQASDACWQEVKAAHAPALKRDDVAMAILWPSTGPLVFFGDELPRLPASAFVMEEIGLSPPGSGLRVTAGTPKVLPAASFRLRTTGKTVSAPAMLVPLTVAYQDPLTSPVTYADGTVKWTNTIKRARKALKTVTIQWVVLTGLKAHGFATDTAVVNMPVPTLPALPGKAAEQIPFVTERSRALTDSLVWWSPTDQPGTLTAAVARAATFPDLRERVALLNRILIIDPKHVDALNVLSRNLYAVLIREAEQGHKLFVKDPALSLVLNEFYWNLYAAETRLDLSNAMEMGGLAKPSAADYLYRLLPTLQTLAALHPEQLDVRFRLGVAYRLNNDQVPMIETFESLVKEIPDSRKTPKAEALLQLAWSRINKVSWNRILHDPDSLRAYADAEAALAQAEQPLDKFLAEYTMAYSMIFMPNYGDKAKLLQHLTDAKRWYDEVPGKTDEVWRFFLHAELLKAILDADPLFQPILATAAAPAPGP